MPSIKIWIIPKFQSKVAIIRVLSEEFVEELRAFPLFVLGSGAQINV